MTRFCSDFAPFWAFPRHSTSVRPTISGRVLGHRGQPRTPRPTAYTLEVTTTAVNCHFQAHSGLKTFLTHHQVEIHTLHNCKFRAFEDVTLKSLLIFRPLTHSRGTFSSNSNPRATRHTASREESQEVSVAARSWVLGVTTFRGSRLLLIESLKQVRWSLY